jgi:hypothetical protein
MKLCSLEMSSPVLTDKWEIPLMAAFKLLWEFVFSFTGLSE